MKVRPLILTALFAVLTAAGALIRIPTPFSAITLQFFCTAAAGVLLGAKYGAVSQILYVLLGLMGLPVFAMGGGIGYVLQPSFGFTLGLIGAAWVMGHMTRQRCDARRVALACAAGLGAVYAVGLPYMAAILNGYMGLSLTAWQLILAGVLPFLPADALKVVLCALLFPRLRRILGNIH